MSNKMKAAVLHEFGQPLEIEEVDIPTAGAGQIVVKMQASGVCHTDLHAIEGDWPVKPSPPFIPGHEGVGLITAVGDNVHHVKEGDRVGIPWLNSGYSVNGSFAEYVLADANYVGIIPESVDSIEIAPVLCAGVTVYKGLKMTDTKPGDWVVISGIGGLGHMAVQYAIAMGLNVAAVDIDDEKLAFAKKLGAKVTVNAKNTDPAEYLQKEIGGAHGALVTAVSSKAFDQALGMLRRGGTLVCNGLPTGEFPVSIFDTVLNGITIRGSIVGTRLDLQESLDMAAAGKVKATVAAEPLENINDIFDRMRDGKIEGRIVIDYSM